MNRTLGILAAGFVLAAVSASAATAQEAIDWRPCPLGDAEAGAECALVPMPRFHDRDSSGSPTIEVAVKRVLRGPDATGQVRQLWFLNGGPGDSGVEALVRLAPMFADVPVDLYSLDHRGVGGTALLECPAEQAGDSAEGREVTQEEWASCARYLRDHRDDLEALTTTQSTYDLARLIESSRSPGDQVIVFGASYGTYWVNRFLQLFPDQADAVILDGLVPADWTMAEFDSGLAATATELLRECGRQAVCREHLGDDPVAVATALPGRIDAGHCSVLGIDGATVRLILGNMLMAGEDVRPYIAPVIHRFDQCRWRDVFAIGDLFATLFESGAAGQEPESHSQVLQRHVSLSELWPDPPPAPEQLEGIVAASPMTTEVASRFARGHDSWPRYPREPLFGEWAAYDGPALLLHGSRDPTMPVERLAEMRRRYAGPGQSFVLVENAGHVVINSGPCVRSIYAAFLMNPGTDLDTGCLADRPPVNLEALPDDAESLFLTPDLWGDDLGDIELLAIAVGAFLVVTVSLTVRWLVRRRRRRRRPAA